MDFLATYISNSVAVGIKPDWRIERCLSSCKTDADVPMRLGIPFASVLQHSLRDLAFPVPPTFPDCDVRPRHAEALVRCDMLAGLVEYNVRSSILIAHVRAVRFWLGMTVVDGRGESRVCYAVGILEVLLVIHAADQLAFRGIHVRGKSNGLLFGCFKEFNRPALCILHFMMAGKDGITRRFEVGRLGVCNLVPHRRKLSCGWIFALRIGRRS